MFDVIYNGSDKELEQTIDLNSFAALYLVNEICNNYDCVGRSIYFYYNSKDKKIHAGPIWDMDTTMGMEPDGMKKDFKKEEIEGWQVREKQWYKALYRHENFRKKVNDIYKKKNVEKIMDGFLNDFIALTEKYELEGTLDYILRSSDRQYENCSSKSYKEECEYVINYQKKRNEWIKNNFLN